MRHSFVITTVLVFVLALSASAWAGSVNYYANQNWSPGTGSSSGFSSAWFYNIISKRAKFDTTITFIDNTSYSWHSTLRGPGEYLATKWLSSQVKKAHCRSNVNASVDATCVAVS